MKKLMTLITVALTGLFLAGCSDDQPTQSSSQTQQSSAPMTASAPAPSNKSGGTTGTVTETMDAAGYTYVQVDDGTEKIWAAAPKFNVAVGDQVVVPDGMPMHNYHSQTLNRDFPVVYFVDSVLNGSAPVGGAVSGAEMPQGHPPTTVAAAPAEVDLSDVEKAEGGLTVGEVFSEKEGLAGEPVTVRAKVVKFSPQIMGKNWIHLQDGSGDQSAGTHDLTVTTSANAQVGDTVVVSGPLTLDKDFGYGYKYNVIIEDAQVAVE